MKLSLLVVSGTGFIVLPGAQDLNLVQRLYTDYRQTQL
jgi:hypothetical protein